MNSTLITFDNDRDNDSETKIKEEQEESSTIDTIEYDPLEAELFAVVEEPEVEEDEVVEAIEEDYHFEIVVDDTKENMKGNEWLVQSATSSATSRPKFVSQEQVSDEFVIIHEDDSDVMKAYQCDICAKSFKDRSKLRSHREIHTEERNVICPVSLA